MTSRLISHKRFWQRLICIRVRVKLLMEVAQHHPTPPHPSPTSQSSLSNPSSTTSASALNLTATLLSPSLSRQEKFIGKCHPGQHQHHWPPPPPERDGPRSSQRRRRSQSAALNGAQRSKSVTAARPTPSQNFRDIGVEGVVGWGEGGGEHVC